MQLTRESIQVVPRLWKTSYGVINVVPDNNLITSSMEHYGEWAENELNLVSELLCEGATVVEIGSEYGIHALCLAQTVGSRGQVHVIENDRLTHLQLCANVALNGHGNIYTYTGTPRKWDVAIGELDLESFQLIKVNAPGRLVGLLMRDRELIVKHKPYLYFRLDSWQQAQKEVETVKALGYRCWSHIAYLYNPDNQAGNRQDLFPGWAHQNVVAAPRDAGIGGDLEHLREI